MGNPISRLTNTADAARLTVRLIGTRNVGPATAASICTTRQPIRPEAAMIAIWASAVGETRATTAAAMAILARVRSGHDILAMPHTACATTATATTFRP